MNKAVPNLFALLFLNAFLMAELFSQDRQTQSEEIAFGSGFFDQLLTIFGRFRNADLQNVFQEAQPIQCTELIGHKGEWRPVAFFNKDRRLGYWCRGSLEEVKADLTAFKFKGSCSDESNQVQVVTKFPTAAGVKAYRQGIINLDQIDIIVNDPVHAFVNPKTKAYTFELPYLFSQNEGSRKLFSFNAPSSKSVYDTDVSSLWECKAVFSKDVIYRFLVCRVSTVQKNMRLSTVRNPAFGENAFFILSDGTEARASVKLTFDDRINDNEKPEESATVSGVAAPPCAMDGSAR
jgi:hypothetical protein